MKQISVELHNITVVSNGWIFVSGEEMMDMEDRKEVSVMDERGGKERAGEGVRGPLCLTLSLMMEEGQSYSTVERI